MRSPGHPPTKRGKEQGQRGPWATWGPRAPNKEERGQGGRKEGKDRGKGARRERERERGPKAPSKQEAGRGMMGPNGSHHLPEAQGIQWVLSPEPWARDGHSEGIGKSASRLREREEKVGKKGLTSSPHRERAQCLPLFLCLPLGKVQGNTFWKRRGAQGRSFRVTDSSKDAETQLPTLSLNFALVPF